jgi:hypothetical protein
VELIPRFVGHPERISNVRHPERSRASRRSRGTCIPAQLRFVLLITALATLAGWMFSLSNRALAAAPAPQVQLNTAGSGPREVEDQTERAVIRDYGKAWQVLSDARGQNQPNLLGTMFVGAAKDQVTQAIQDQQKSGVRLRYVDHGHKLQAVFYSQEGSALQLRDSAQLEIQVLDGNSVVHTEEATVNYLVVMTPAADHWQVRMLQAVP